MTTTLQELERDATLTIAIPPWSAVKSFAASVLSDIEGPTSTSAPSPTSTSAPPPPPPPPPPTTPTTTMITQTPPRVTTISTTISHTTILTVSAITTVEAPSLTSIYSYASTSSTSLAGETSSKSIGSPLVSSAVGSTTQTPLPGVVTDSPSEPLSSTFPFQTHSPMVTSSPSAQSPTREQLSPKKQAIIGGLCGAIGGLIIFGVVICLCLRWRRRREEQGESFVEKGGHSPAPPLPIYSHFTNSRVTVGTPTSQVPPGMPARSIEEHLIRMNLDRFERPFVGMEGWRESVGPGRLRVMNPDLSRPSTPNPGSERAGSFLRRQRSAFAAVLLGANRSRTSSRASTTQQPVGGLPAIHVDEALSREYVAGAGGTPSFKSYPSVSTTPVVAQQPPDDPFYIPPSLDPVPERPSRPSLAPIQSSRGRTSNHLGSVLNPFRSTSSNVVQSVRTTSKQSVETTSTRFSQRDTTYSDPFDLDNASVGGSRDPAIVEGGKERNAQNWNVYEGT